MLRPEIYERSPMRAFGAFLDGGLAPGELGVVLGRAGVGKSALLVHIALDHIVRDRDVLHVSLRDAADHVRSFYDEIYREVTRTAGFLPEDRLAVRVGRHRAIHCFLDGRLDAPGLAAALDTAGAPMGISPEVVLVDGMDPPGQQQLASFRQVAAERRVAVWMALRTHRAADPPGDLLAPFSTAVVLEPRGSRVRLRAAKVHGIVPARPHGLDLDPRSLLVWTEGSADPASAPLLGEASRCTLYSGGAAGAEAAFGELAELYGIEEVNFTFPGHEQVRTRGSRVLGEQELAAGDVSLLYVSQKLHREWRSRESIRPVLQSLWHQVGKAQQVFVVGRIREDGTVSGGTGWSVELARRWHKELWVYDEERAGWRRWNGSEWEAGLPVVDREHFCGTGTRHISSDAREALRDLYRRSFGPAPGEA